MSNYSTLQEIYMGHPDAKDEINYGDENIFLQCFVLPPNNEIDMILNNHQFIINGFKGVGKTALLFYLESECLAKDPSSCTSFILFKSDYKDIDKDKLDTAAKKLIKSVSFEHGTMENVSDFTDIWKLILFKKMIEDNGDYSNNLFENNQNWEDFCKQVNSIQVLNSSVTHVLRPSKLKFINNTLPDGSMVSGVEIDLQKEIDFKSLALFSDKMQIITSLFLQLNKTDIPYYLFVDELEAFYGDEKTFKRDLTMLRDLIFSIKEINYLAMSVRMKSIKIICSVRTEIVNSIYRFIPTKELNKVMGSFECKLNWNSTNTVSIEHPLFQILLKRLEITDKSKGVIYENLTKVYEAWFEQDEASNKVVNYILNSLWNKPRDIIRLINAFKKYPRAGVKLINQDVMNQSFKEYSYRSLEEIAGELNALYTPMQSEVFMTWLRGFKSPFTLREFKERIKEFSNSKLFMGQLDIELLLSDLYRTGIIGNYNPYLRSHRWHHKNDEQVIIDEDWLYVIHNGLNSALSVTRAKKEKEHNPELSYSFDKYALKKNDIYEGNVIKINKSFVRIDICHKKQIHKAAIQIHDVIDGYVNNLEDYFVEGETIRVRVISYNEKFKTWQVKKVD